MIRCLAIDDEMLALDLIEDNIKKIPFLELVKTCRSAMEALEIMQAQKIDLIFLDIQMPDITGIQLLKSLRNRPLVVLTTAFSNYAKEGFDLDVIDYLLKPYSFDRFMKAVNKAQEYMKLRDVAMVHVHRKEGLSGEPCLFVRAGYKLVKILFHEILYVEGLKDYVKIVTPEKTVITQMSMKTMEERLPSGEFIRVHRSFIVAFNKIESIQKQALSIGEKEIPISEQYREQIFKIIHYEKPTD